MSDSEQYGVYTRYSGFMASDREPEICQFGPSTKSACEQKAEDLNYDKGPGSHTWAYVAPYRGKQVGG